jgi:flagellar protein FlgJ
MKKPAPGSRPPAPALKEAARAFEAYFISSLLKEMRKTIPTGGFVGSGRGQEIYQFLLDEALAKKMSETGGIGLSKLLVQKYRG